MSLAKTQARTASNTNVAEMAEGAMGVRISAGTARIEVTTSSPPLDRTVGHSATGVAAEIERARD